MTHDQPCLIFNTVQLNSQSVKVQESRDFIKADSIIIIIDSINIYSTV